MIKLKNIVMIHDLMRQGFSIAACIDLSVPKRREPVRSLVSHLIRITHERSGHTASPGRKAPRRSSQDRSLRIHWQSSTSL